MRSLWQQSFAPKTKIKQKYYYSLSLFKEQSILVYLDTSHTWPRPWCVTAAYGISHTCYISWHLMVNKWGTKASNIYFNKKQRRGVTINQKEDSLQWKQKVWLRGHTHLPSAIYSELINKNYSREMRELKYIIRNTVCCHRGKIIF